MAGNSELRATVQEAQNTAICEGLCGAINQRQNLMCLRYTDHDGECFRPDDIGMEKCDTDCTEHYDGKHWTVI